MRIIFEGASGAVLLTHIPLSADIDSLIAGGALPDLPWANYMVLPEDYPDIAGGDISVGDWSDPATLAVRPIVFGPSDFPLQPFQFEAMLFILSDQKGFDVGAAIDTAIAAIPGLSQRALAKGKRKSPPGGKFDRSDPLFSSLAPAVGLTPAEIDAAWMTAKDLS